MRKWLAALFLMCMTALPALAEEELFHDLCGLWYWDGESPAAPLADAVYLHADGSCVLYDAPKSEHPDQPVTMTVRAQGTWTLLDDTLLAAAGDEMHILPVKTVTTWDPEYIDGLQIGEGVYLNYAMRNLTPPTESLVPPEILRDIRAWYGSPVIEDYQELPDIGGRPMGFLLVQHEGARELWLYRFTEKGWRMDNVHSGGIPQAQLADVWLSVNRKGGEFSGLWYDEDRYDYVYPDGPTLGIWTSNGETIEERVEYVWHDNAFRLVHYGHNPVCQIDVVDGDTLVFYNISDPEIDIVRYSFNRELWTVDFYDLPRRAEEVRITGPDEPPMPAYIRPPIMDKQSFLVPQDVELLKGKTWPVYIGPGKSYGRAANGKASVSTNDWVQVFGEYEGWLLIHYAVSAEQYRFGWITADALAPGENAGSLSFVFRDIVGTEVDVTLTDDPLNSGNPLATVSPAADIEYLAQLGERYSYVRVVVDGRTWMGFVPSWPLGHG